MKLTFIFLAVAAFVAIEAIVTFAKKEIALLRQERTNSLRMFRNSNMLICETERGTWW